MDNLLDTELATYLAQLENLSAAHAGEYVVIRGSDVLGFYSSYDDALKAGYGKFDLDAFFVKQIILDEEPALLPVDRLLHAELSLAGHPS